MCWASFTSGDGGASPKDRRSKCCLSLGGASTGGGGWVGWASFTGGDGVHPLVAGNASTGWGVHPLIGVHPLVGVCIHWGGGEGASTHWLGRAPIDRDASTGGGGVHPLVGQGMHPSPCEQKDTPL